MSAQIVCSCVSGQSLNDAGESFKRLAEVKYSLEENVKQNFLEPLSHLQSKDLKEVNVSMAGLCVLEVLVCPWRLGVSLTSWCVLEGLRKKRMAPMAEWLWLLILSAHLTAVGLSLAGVTCETSQVLLAGGQVFFVWDLTFSHHLTIDSAQNECDRCLGSMIPLLATADPSYHSLISWAGQGKSNPQKKWEKKRKENTEFENNHSLRNI